MSSANIEKARELQQAIEGATGHIKQLREDIANMEREEQANQQELQRLANRQAEIQLHLGQRRQELQVCQEQVAAREAQYMKFVESQPTLVRVFK
jgi:chromosome segregation ATPase